MIKKYVFAATLLVICLYSPAQCANPRHAIFKQIRTKKIELFAQQYLEFQDVLQIYIKHAQAFETAQNEIGTTCKQLLDQNIVKEEEFEAINMFLVQKIGEQEKPNVAEITQKAVMQFPALASKEAQKIVTEICNEYIRVIPVFMEFATASETVDEHNNKLEQTKRELVETGMTREEVETLEREIVQEITQMLEASMEQPPASNTNKTT